MSDAQDISFIQQTDYYLAENKTNVIGYEDVLPLLLKDFETMMKDKYDTSMHSIRVPPWLYVCLITVGITCNLLNMVILTRPSMAAPLNLLLASLELVNISIFLAYFPELIASKYYPDDRLTYKWNVTFSFARATASAGVFASNWISVSIGMWRFIAITWPLSASRVFNGKVAKLCLCVVLLSAIAIAAVLYCLNVAVPYVVAVYDNVYSESPLFFKTLCVSESIIHFEDDSRRFLTESILQFFSTTVPCIVSGLFTLLLIINLCKANRNRRKLSERNSQVSKVNGSDATTGKVTNLVERKLTIILLLILVMSNLSYLPHTIVYGYLSVNDQSILNSPIYNISESGIGVILSNCFTFLVYITMSERFRSTAKDILFKLLRIQNKGLNRSNTTETAKSNV